MKKTVLLYSLYLLAQGLLYAADGEFEIRMFHYNQDYEAVSKIVLADLNRLTPLPGNAYPDDQKKASLIKKFRHVAHIGSHMTPYDIIPNKFSSDAWIVACSNGRVVAVSNCFLTNDFNNYYIETISMSENNYKAYIALVNFIYEDSRKIKDIGMVYTHVREDDYMTQKILSFCGFMQSPYQNDNEKHYCASRWVKA